MKFISIMIIFLLTAFPLYAKCNYQKQLAELTKTHINTREKSLRGWIRVFSKKERLFKRNIHINDDKRKEILNTLKKCLEENSIGRIS